MAPRFRIASLRGPLPIGGGYTWFENRGLGRPLGSSLRASADAVWAWLDGLDVAQVDPARVVLLGFSAGMLMAGALVLDRPERFRAAVLLSGTLPWDVDEFVPVPGRFERKPIFHAHGRYDDVIPADLVTRTEGYLMHDSGALLRSQRYPMAHEIVGPELDDLARWFDAN